MVWVGGGRERKNIKSVYKSKSLLVCMCVCVYKSISCVQLILLTFTSSWAYLSHSLLEHFKTLMEL